MLSYREIAPPSDISHLVLSFWEFTARSDSSAPIPHEIFPDGCISIMRRRNERLNISGFMASMLHSRLITVPVFSDDVLWSIRLSPAACARVIGSDPAVWQTRFWRNGDSLFGLLDNDLLAALGTCSSLEDAVDVYAARLRSLKIERENLDQVVLEAVSIIEETMGETRIGTLAEQLGLSVRQFERRFKRSAGIPPKQYARARRFRAAATALVTGERVNWADRAAEMGFADQAHLAREFSYLTGRSPRSFAEKIKSIDHGHLIT